MTSAASIAAYGALALALTAGLQFPYGDAAVIVAALLAVTIALPYLEGAHLRWFLVANYAVVVAVLYRGFQPDPHMALPFWLEFSVVVGGGALGAYLLLFLLWQFTERLRHTLERTRRAHREAECARQRASFLAEASRRLGVSSLDYLATLRSVAELAVPALADSCLIDDLDGEGILKKVEATHVDPSLRGLLELLHDSYFTTALHPAWPVMNRS